MMSRRAFLAVGALLGMGVFFPWKIRLPNFLRIFAPTPPRLEPERILLQNADDLKAFRRFYERNFSFIYRYVHFRVKRDVDAEDLTAEVFTKSWRSLPSYDEEQEAQLLGWLLCTAHDLTVEFHRNQQYPFLRNIPRENGWKWNVFERLPRDQQLILYLSSFEDYSHREIANVLGKSPNAIGVAKYRAFQQLSGA